MFPFDPVVGFLTLVHQSRFLTALAGVVWVPIHQTRPTFPSILFSFYATDTEILIYQKFRMRVFLQRI
jgi:hypothetical protein